VSTGSPAAPHCVQTELPLAWRHVLPTYSGGQSVLKAVDVVNGPIPLQEYDRSVNQHRSRGFRIGNNKTRSSLSRLLQIGDTAENSKADEPCKNSTSTLLSLRVLSILTAISRLELFHTGRERSHREHGCARESWLLTGASTCPSIYCPDVRAITINDFHFPTPAPNRDPSAVPPLCHLPGSACIRRFARPCARKHRYRIAPPIKANVHPFSAKQDVPVEKTLYLSSAVLRERSLLRCWRDS
jgi:hypothetical protein